MNIVNLLSTRNAFRLALVLSFLFATFPGKGGLEGDQREIAELSQRTDNWGFVTPFIYGEWPDFFGNWRFSLVLCQLFLFWMGLFLLFSGQKLVSRSYRFGLFALIGFSSVFVSQLWRDATLLSLAVFGFGIISKAKQTSGVKRILLFAFGILFLTFSAMFKPLYGPILAIFFVWQLSDILKRTFKNFPLILLILLSLTFVPFALDKELSSNFGLKKVAPEQQPMIFDLASSYCWGQSDQLVNDAAAGLKIVLRPGFPLQLVCASLRPNSWDNLHSNPQQLQYPSPIQRLINERVLEVPKLRDKWISMIRNNFVDWIQVRAMYLGLTLTMTNSFVPQNETNTWGGISGEINSFIWSVIFDFASAIDKTRLSSMFFGFLVILTSLTRSRRKDFPAMNSQERLLGDDKFALLVLTATTIVTLIGFVASNGRYILPYILLTYFFLIRSKGCRSAIQV